MALEPGLLPEYEKFDMSLSSPTIKNLLRLTCWDVVPHDQHQQANVASSPSEESRPTLPLLRTRVQATYGPSSPVSGSTDVCTQQHRCHSLPAAPVSARQPITRDSDSCNSSPSSRRTDRSSLPESMLANVVPSLFDLHRLPAVYSASPRDTAQPPLRPPAPDSTGAPLALQKWSRDAHGPRADHVSEFTEARPVASGKGLLAFLRPANKRDLGHRCQQCRQPFNALGALLVAQRSSGPKGGPGQRFHEECWFAARPSTGSRAAWRGVDLPQAYAEAWQGVEESSGGWAKSSNSSVLDPSRAASVGNILDGMFSHEDEFGQRRISRGFSAAEIDDAIARWAYDGLDEEEDCAICFSKQKRSLRLPCSSNHVFCAECLIPWLRKCSLCPTCRRDLRPFLASRQLFPGNNRSRVLPMMQACAGQLGSLQIPMMLRTEC